MLLKIKTARMRPRAAAVAALNDIRTDMENNKTIRSFIIILTVVLAVWLIFKLFFVRTVNYEIGGIKIPSEYNMVTGTVKPIVDYKGSQNIPTVQVKTDDKKVGLSEDQAVMAQLRWAIFEDWAKSRPEYKGWESNAEIFKAANDAFRKEVEKNGPRFRIVK